MSVCIYDIVLQIIWQLLHCSYCRFNTDESTATHDQMGMAIYDEAQFQQVSGIESVNRILENYE